MNISNLKNIKKRIKKAAVDNFVKDYYPIISSSGDFLKLNNSDTIVQNVLNILRIKKGEYIFNCNVGNQLYKYLFEPRTRATAEEIKQEIYDSITTQEPRAIIEDIDVKFLKNEYGFAFYITLKLLNGERRRLSGIFKKDSFDLYEVE